MELIRLGIDDDRLVLLDDITHLEIGFHQDFKHFIDGLAFHPDDRCRVKHIRNRSAYAHVPAILVESGTYFRCGTVYVIRQCIYNHHGAVRPKAFVTQLLVYFIRTALGLIEGAINDRLRYIVRLCPFQNDFQSAVRFRIRLAFLGGNINFDAELRVDPAGIGVFRSFLLFNIVPFAAHTVPTF
ncbi:hypothetical protein D3C74_322370 [compost metagenome]